MVFSMFCMDKLLISSFQLEQIADGSERQHRDFYDRFTQLFVKQISWYGQYHRYYLGYG